MNRFVLPNLILPCAMLAACGGGGDAAPASPSPAGAAQAASAIAAPVPSLPSSQLAQLASPPAETTCGLPGFQQEMLDRINLARASGRNCGTTAYSPVPPLAWSGRLFDAAAAQADDMAGNDYFSHVSQDGRSFDQRIGATGYAWSAVGENIAAGQTGTAQVMEAWLQSPGHCANVMSASFTEVAVACVRNPAASYGTYWAMELARPRA